MRLPINIIHIMAITLTNMVKVDLTYRYENRPGWMAQLNDTIRYYMHAEVYIS